MILFALSLDLILGYAGIVSLGHAAFFGVGAYSAALLAKHGWGEPITGLVVAAAAAALRRRRLGLGAAAHARPDAPHADPGRDHPAAGAVQRPLRHHRRLRRLHGLLDRSDLRHSSSSTLIVRYRNISTRSSCCSSPSSWCARIVHSPFGRSSSASARTSSACTRSARRCIAGWSRSTPSRRRSPASPAGCLPRPSSSSTLAVLSFDVSGKILIMLILGGTGRLYGAFVGGCRLHDPRGPARQSLSALLASRHRRRSGPGRPVRAPRRARPCRATWPRCFRTRRP